MKKFCEDLKKHVKRIINYEKKEMLPLAKKEQKMHDEAKACYICKKDLVLMLTMKSIIKPETIVIIQENTETLPLVFVI